MQRKLIITPAEGGEDSYLLTQDFMKAYTKFAKNMNWSFT